jgi:hypothetical protein
MSNQEEVVLLFPARKEGGFKEAGPIQDIKVGVSKILEWFKDYKVESIELTLEGAFKTGILTQLIISAEGKGGCKVKLVPKNSS